MKKITPEGLAERLMMRVYVPFSAVVSLDEMGGVLLLDQFDTAFAGETMTVDPRAAEVWLMTNHPEGRRELTEADERNARRLLAKKKDVRVFIVGEDVGCIEVEIERKA